MTPNCELERKYYEHSVTIYENLWKNILKFEHENSIHIIALRLFNKLPRKLRDNFNISLLEWKIELDEFLDTIPDKPIVTGLTPGQCNHLQPNLLIPYYIGSHG